MKFFKSVILLVIVGFGVTLAKPVGLDYLSPVENSQLNARTSQIILRPANDVALSNDMFEVIGSTSGVHKGELVHSDFKNTWIFKPYEKFDAGETVTVNVSGADITDFSYTFTVTPLEEPLDPRDFEELRSFGQVDMPPMLNKNFIAGADSLPSDFPHYEITVNNNPSAGDIFISPVNLYFFTGYNLIIGNDGTLKYWKKFDNGAPMDFKVAPNSQLSYGLVSDFYEFGGGGDTEFYLMDNSYSIVDQYQMSNGYIADFHEFQLLPNGNYLMVTYDLQPVNMAQYAQGGNPKALVAGSIIQELDASKNVVFQWRSWDYFDITDSYADFTQIMFDAIHINALELDDDGHLLASVLGLAEITKINRSTGDIMWRMGGKNNEFTFINEDETWAPLYFQFQHDVRRTPTGTITMFDGGDKEGGRRQYSRVVEYQVDEQAKTAEKIWEFVHDPVLVSTTMGSCQRLENGNTVIGWGFASMTKLTAVTEVDPAGNVVYELKFKTPLKSSYRAMRFDWDGGEPAADVMRQELLVGNRYDFNNDGAETGVELKFTEMCGSEAGCFGYNECYVRRYNHSPITPSFPGKAPMVLPTRIIIDKHAIGTPITADLAIDAEFYGIEHPDSIVIYNREFPDTKGMFFPIPTVYNPATKKVIGTMTKFGEFVLAYPDHKSTPYPPMPLFPKAGSTVDQTASVKLEWAPIGNAKTFHLQIAKDEAFTNLVYDNDYVEQAVHTLETVDANATYYWKVKAYDADDVDGEWSQVSSFNTGAPYVNVTYPNGGEGWQIGLEYYIQWDDNIAEDIVLELFKGNTKISTIDTTRSSGSYKWEVPLGTSQGNDYQIKAYSATRGNVTDTSDNGFTLTPDATSVASEQTVPTEFELSQNYPNPFNPVTRISYSIPHQSHVKLVVYDVLGHEVETLVNEQQTANTYQVNFDASHLTTGIYFYQLQAGNAFQLTRKMLLVR